MSAQNISAREAAALVRSGDWLDYGATLAQPDVFDQALAERASELRNVNISGCLSVRPRAVVEVDPGREHFNFFNWHFGGYDRKKGDAGLQNYIPCNLGEISDYYRIVTQRPAHQQHRGQPLAAVNLGEVRRHMRIIDRQQS